MRLFFRYAGIILRSQMQHKTSFLLTTLGQFLVSFTGFLGVYFLFERFSGVPGFTYNEVLVCYGVILAAFSLAECFARGFDAFRGVISNGEFDRIMVRPQGLVLQVLGARMEFSRVGRLVQAVVILIYALRTSGIAWGPDKVLTLALMIGCGVLVYFALFMVYASFCFFTTEALEFMNILTDGTREFGKYPFSIYGEGVLKFLTYVVPIALFQYYPLLYLLGHSTSLLYMFCPLIALLFLIPCYGFWRFGVRHYKSTGS